MCTMNGLAIKDCGCMVVAFSYARRQMILEECVVML
jgi:hypothetical protein